jgi:outer membrane protein
MKFVLFSVSVLLLIAGAGTNAQNASSAAAKVGIVDIQGAIANTKEGQKALAGLKAKFEPIQTRLTQKQAEIESDKTKLNQGANAMTPDQRDRLARGIDQKIKSLNRDTEDARAQFEQENSRIMDPLGRRVLAVIERYSKEHGFALVLDVSSQATPVLYASNNITNDITKLYDQSPPAK